MARLQSDDRKITASDLYHGTMLFKPDNAYEAAKFQQIAFALDLEWSNRKKNYVTDYALTREGFVIEGAKLSLTKKITTSHIFGLDDIDEKLYPEITLLSIDDIHNNDRWFMPRNASEAVVLLDMLQQIKCEWPDNSGPATMETILATGIAVHAGVIRSGLGYASDHGALYTFNEISAVPALPESIYVVKIFNQLAASEKLIKEQTALIKNQNSLIEKQSEIIEKIYNNINGSALKFDKGP